METRTIESFITKEQLVEMVGSVSVTFECYIDNIFTFVGKSGDKNFVVAVDDTSETIKNFYSFAGSTVQIKDLDFTFVTVADNNFRRLFTYDKAFDKNSL